MKVATVSELIVQTLDIARDRFYDTESADPRSFIYAAAIHQEYSEYKKKYDFTGAAFRARAKVIDLILREWHDENRIDK